MSVAAAQSTTPAPPRPPAADYSLISAATLIARSSVAGVMLVLLASASLPSQGQQVDARA